MTMRMLLRRKLLAGAGALVVPATALAEPCGEEERRKLIRFSFIPEANACGSNSGVTPTVTVDFSTATGKTLNKSMWGFTSSVFSGQVFSNATFRSTAAANLQPAALAINSDWDLDTAFANGDMSNINPILNNYRSFCQSGVRGFMGVCRKTNVGLTPAQSGTRAANFASYLQSNGFTEWQDFIVGNEWEEGQNAGPGTISETDAINYFSAVADALHGVNANFRVWGPAQWDPGFYANATWGNAPSMTTRCGGVLWMSYDVAGGGTMTDSKATVYGPKGFNNPDGPNQASALSGTPLASVPFGSYDWNMSETVIEAGQYIGGLYQALYVLGQFKQVGNCGVAGGSFFCAQGIGGSNWTGNAIGSPSVGSDMTRVTCGGYILGKAGQSVFGPEYVVTNGIPNFAIVAVKPTSSTFAIMMVNYDTVNSQTINLALNGLTPTGTIARWEIGKSGGTTPTPTTSTQASLSSVTVGSEMCVILTGGTGTPPPPSGNGNAFTDNFAFYNSNIWAKSPAFDDGGDAYFADDPSIQAQTEVYSGGHLNLNLINIGSNRFGAPPGKLYFAGIQDTYNCPNNFAQQYGFWEITCTVDKLPGVGFFCFTISPFNFPPNFAMPNIWTDGSNTMQLAMFASNVSSSEYFIAEGTNGWTGTVPHAYGMKWSPTVIQFYIDRVRVVSTGNPGGAYTNGDPCYTKIHAQSNFYPDQLDVSNSSLLPKGGHVFKFDVWTLGASPV